MAVTGVVGVTAPLDRPENQVGDSVSCDEAIEGRLSFISNEDAKLSDNDGQSRGDDSGEYLSQSVSNNGRWLSNTVAMSEVVVAKQGTEAGTGKATFQGMLSLLIDEG